LLANDGASPARVIIEVMHLLFVLAMLQQCLASAEPAEGGGRGTATLL
jgi:hypothetical protein